LTRRAAFPSVVSVATEFLKSLKHMLAICMFGGFLGAPAILLATDVVLDLGGGEKMEFIWVPVTTSGAKKEIKIGDFSNPDGKEPVQKELIWGPFEVAGKGWGYYIGKTEVTEAQWAAVMGSGSKSGRPLTNQPHQAIQEYIQKLNSGALGGQISGLPRKADSTPGVIRLPTESEWEYAARCGAGPDYKNKHPYGEDRDVERFEVIASPGGGGKAREAGTLPPNKLGLHDMLGNVREFVEGTYSAGGSQLLKGGSYLSEKQEICSSARTEQPPFGKDGKPASRPDAGFRLCITAPEITSLGQALTPVEKDASDPVPSDRDGGVDPADQEANNLIASAINAKTGIKKDMRFIELVKSTYDPTSKENGWDDADRKIAELKLRIAKSQKTLESAVSGLRKLCSSNREAVGRALAANAVRIDKDAESRQSKAVLQEAECMRELREDLGF